MNYKGSAKNCCVYECTNNSRKRAIWANSTCEEHNLLHKDCPCLQPFSLHRFPRDELRKQKWIAAINRKGYIPGKFAVVCSDHFIDRIPTEKNPTPQLKLGYNKKVAVGRADPKRRHAYLKVKRAKRKCLGGEGTDCLEGGTHADINCADVDQRVTNQSIERVNAMTATVAVQTDQVDKGVQWEDPTLIDHDYCATNLQGKRHISKGTQANMKLFSYHELKNVDCKFYTGLDLAVFMKLVIILSASVSFRFGLEVGNQLLLVFMRLRLGLIYADLGRRFEISTSLACKIFTSWLPVLRSELQFLVSWLSKETLRLTMPVAFKANYPQTTCIIDCTEMFINRPKLLSTRAQTYSSYKQHNTVKAMVCIAPCGYFMFVSKCFGGRASDKFIVTNSGVLNYLLPGDEVMADRDFTIDLEVASSQAKLNIPAFTKGKPQLTDEDVTNTRRIATVRIHVERAIGRLKNFRIFKNTMSSKILKKEVDDILIVCSALCNSQTPILRSNGHV